MKKFIFIVCAVLTLSIQADASILVFSEDGSFSPKATLSEAATALDAAGKTVVITSALSAVQSNISSATLHAWPGDRKLTVAKGGKIAPTTKFVIANGGADSVKPDWFGVNTTPGTTDMTAAIKLALATTRNVEFEANTYGHTGGLVQSTAGQKVSGASYGLIGYATSGTVLKKLSGTGTSYEMASHSGTLENISFDNNSLAGTGILANQHRMIIRNIEIGGVAGTSYAMDFQSVNTSLVENIHIRDGNYGGISATGTDALLYSTLKNIFIGTMGGGYAMTLVDTIGTSFTNFYHENSIKLGANCVNVDFYNYNAESGATSTPLVDIDGATIYNVNFYGVRVLQQLGVDRTAAIFKIKNAHNVSVRGLFVQDLSSATPSIFYTDGVKGLSIYDTEIYNTNAFTFLSGNAAGGYSTNIVLSNCNSIDGAIGTVDWFASNGISVNNSNLSQTFTAIETGSRIKMSNVSATINTANIAATVYVALDSCTSVLDANSRAFMVNCLLTNGLRVDSGRVATTTLSVGTGATVTWSGGIPAGAMVKAVALRNNTAITGAAGFTGYTAGITGDTDAFGTNLDPANAATSGIWNYTITSPFYNPDNSGLDIILTAVGGNFASGTVRITVVYDTMNVPSS